MHINRTNMDDDCVYAVGCTIFSFDYYHIFTMVVHCITNKYIVNWCCSNYSVRYVCVFLSIPLLLYYNRANIPDIFNTHNSPHSNQIESITNNNVLVSCSNMCVYSVQCVIYNNNNYSAHMCPKYV